MVRYFLKAIAVLAVLAILLVSNSGVAPVAAQGPAFTFFPSQAVPNASTNDGRFLSIDGNGLHTLQGQATDLEFAVPPVSGLSSFQIGIFDGDSGRDSTGALNAAGGHWDIGTSETLYTLYADPTLSGATSIQIAQWSSNNPNTGGPLWSADNSLMPDNNWWNATITTSSDAQAATNGYYYYHMAVTIPDPSSTSSNGFKLRTTGTMTILPDTTFGIRAAMSAFPQDWQIIYPAFNGTDIPDNNFFLTTPTTYDGHWKMFLSIPTGLTSLPIWDGDFDRGTDPNFLVGDPSGQAITPCSSTPTPGTPSFPPFSSPAALAYGSAGTQPGDPADDSPEDAFRRSPCVYWTITGPNNGTVYTQGDPSGNQDWALFTVGDGSSALPAGVWTHDINGLDLENTVFLHFPKGVTTCGYNADGTPACVPPPYLGSIGDRVWLDANGNGIQDANETGGVAGVKVNLLNSSNQVVATTQTDANGNYLFPNLLAGNYQVQFVAPSGDVFTKQYAQGADGPGFSANNNDSNADVSTGLSGLIPLAMAENDLTVDAGLYQPASVSGFVYVDSNNNGTKDAGEPGIPGVTVTLTGTDNQNNSVNLTAKTGPDGSYSFTGLVPGTYTVTETQPAGFGQGINAIGSQGGTVGPTTDVLSSIVLASGVNGVNNNFGELLGSIGDTVWNDLNGNGIQDDANSGIAGVKVNLTDASGNPVTDALGNPVGQATTDANGKYSFTNLLAGNYKVQFVLPSGFVFTKQYAAGPDASMSNNTDSNPYQTGSSAGTTDSITLGAGRSNPTIDAGMYKPASVSGFVYVDTNNNGIKETGEPPISGVTVTLTGTDNQNNSVNLTTQTGTDGLYSFTNLVPGTYTVTETQPAGFAQGINSIGSQGGTVGPTTDVLSSIVLASGVNGVNNNFGELLGSIGDRVWLDANGNGLQDGTETGGVAGATVKLLDATTGNAATDAFGVTVPTVTTTASGNYLFSNLLGGKSYIVQFTAPSGYTYTQYLVGGGSNAATDSNANPANSGKSGTITLAAGQTDLTWDAGLQQIPPASVSGYVYVDLNNNGTKDSGEPPISGVKVTLTGTDNQGHAVNLTTTTGTDGSYKFSNLVPGTYTVTETQPAGYGQGKNAIGSQGGTVGPTQDVLSNIVLASGVNGVNNNFGELLGSIGDRVWLDANGNGLQDATETGGISGVTVKLLDTSGNAAKDAFGATVPTTTTNASGNYLFSNLLGGIYVVQFTAPSGYTYTQYLAGGGANAATDSNANAANSGKSGTITLAAGQNDLTWDAGMYKPASLGDFVWNDTNNNGIQDAGEPGIPGVTVNLLNSSGAQIATTTTDANGKYSFTNLAPGTYQVQFAAPPGYAYAKYLQGSNKAVDSDANPANSGKSGSITLTSGQTDNTWDGGLTIPDCSVNFNYLKGSIKINTTAHTATGTVINSNTTASYLVGIASYAVTHSDWYTDQILWDSKTATIGPKSTINLTVNLAYKNGTLYVTQVDLFCGPVLFTLNGQLYGNRKLDYFNSPVNQWPWGNYAPVGLKP